jgi:hypothetical protein
MTVNNKMSNLKNNKGQLQIPCTDSHGPSIRKKASQSLVFRAITLTEAVWRQGQKGKITITFGTNGCDGCSPDAAWSLIGNQSSGQKPSMNLGFIDPPYDSFVFKGKTYKAPITATRNYCASGDLQKKCTDNPNKENCSCYPNWVPGATVVHEFGHALGMLHEHQNNLQKSNPIKLKPEAVKTYYRDLGMGDEGAATNVLDTYQCDNSKCDYAGTKYDKSSIMLYYLPDNWIEGKNPTYPNFVLSTDDKSWLKNIYPHDSSNPPIITVEFVDPNPEKWKMAWVEKVVTETYGPLIGIKWNFINGVSETDTKDIITEKIVDYNDNNSVQTDNYIKNNSTSYLKCNSNGALTYKGEELSETDAKNLETTGTFYSRYQIASIIIGGIIGFFLLIIIIYFITAKILNSTNK